MKMFELMSQKESIFLKNLFQESFYVFLLLNDLVATIMTTSRRLTAAFLDHISHQSPPDDSLFWKLWNKNSHIAEKALHTSYIQGIKNGTLSPETYGSYVVNDAYYCFKGADDYDMAAKRDNDPYLKDYLNRKAESFKEYNQEFVKKWHIKDAASVVPIKVCFQMHG